MTRHKLSTEPYKGVRDFYPEDWARQRYIFDTWRTFVEKCGYVEYSASPLEPAELYREKTSEEIVRDQTYTFLDRGDREVTLRPEMTPTLARMVAGRRRELSFPLRWYSTPNIFRYERPQRGRLREHFQLNVDLFGSKHAAADAEIIAMAHGLITAFGAKENDFIIRVSSRVFLNDLVSRHRLSPTQAKRLLGLLDRREKISEGDFNADLREFDITPEELAPNAPPQDVAAVLKPLAEAGLRSIVFDPSIVRGFDYYTGIVFEVFDTHPENNRALFGGGRYDHLLEVFGEDVPAVGFGMGDVALSDFLEVRKLFPPYVSPTKVYIAVTSEALVYEAMKLAGELRRAGVNTGVDLGDKKLGDQIAAAAKQAIPYLLVVGENELQSGQFKVKNLRDSAEHAVARAELSTFLSSHA